MQLGLDGFENEIVPGPDTLNQLPKPEVGVLPDMVAWLPQTVWSAPAFDVEAGFENVT
jgi:hypothetical protein